MPSTTIGALPKRIAHCPIVGAVGEIRFIADIPDDALFGQLYPAFKKDYPNVVRLPIMDLPPAVRGTSDLMFAAQHLLKGEAYNIQIGPRVFNVSITPPYQGWGKFGAKITSAFDRFFATISPSTIERVSLRYTDFFGGDILPKTRIHLGLNGATLLGPETQVRTLISRDGYQHILQFTNAVERAGEEGQSSVKGTAIDVDSLSTNVPLEFASEQGKRNELMDNLHLSGKRLFFETLSQDFLNALGPEY